MRVKEQNEVYFLRQELWEKNHIFEILIASKMIISAERVISEELQCKVGATENRRMTMEKSSMAEGKETNKRNYRP